MAADHFCKLLQADENAKLNVLQSDFFWPGFDFINKLDPNNEDRDVPHQYIWFQQDAALPYFCAAICHFLHIIVPKLKDITRRINIMARLAHLT